MRFNNESSKVHCVSGYSSEKALRELANVEEILEDEGQSTTRVVKVMDKLLNLHYGVLDILENK